MRGVDVHLGGELVAVIEDSALTGSGGARRQAIGQPILSVRLPRWSVPPAGASCTGPGGW